MWWAAGFGSVAHSMNLTTATTPSPPPTRAPGRSDFERPGLSPRRLDDGSASHLRDGHLGARTAERPLMAIATRPVARSRRWPSASRGAPGPRDDGRRLGSPARRRDKGHRRGLVVLPGDGPSLARLARRYRSASATRSTASRSTSFFLRRHASRSEASASRSRSRRPPAASCRRAIASLVKSSRSAAPARRSR